MKTIATHPIHPVCELLPVLPEDQLEELAEDIKANGLKIPIQTFKGKVVDGRNRLLACQLAGVEPKFQEIKTKDGNGSIYDLVKSLNLVRRHLNDDQRAMIGVALVNAKHGQRQSETVVTAGKAAKLVNVSTPTLKRAKIVATKGTEELKKRVMQGEVPMVTAARIAKLPKTKQKQILSGPVRRGTAQEPKRGPKPAHALKLAFIKEVEQEMDDYWPKGIRKTRIEAGYMIKEFSALLRRVLSR